MQSPVKRAARADTFSAAKTDKKWSFKSANKRDGPTSEVKTKPSSVLAATAKPVAKRDPRKTIFETGAVSETNLTGKLETGKRSVSRDTLKNPYYQGGNSHITAMRRSFQELPNKSARGKSVREKVKSGKTSVTKPVADPKSPPKDEPAADQDITPEPVAVTPPSPEPLPDMSKYVNPIWHERTANI